jgi:hypothetical protein
MIEIFLAISAIAFIYGAVRRGLGLTEWLIDRSFDYFTKPVDHPTLARLEAIRFRVRAENVKERRGMALLREGATASSRSLVVDPGKPTGSRLGASVAGNHATAQSERPAGDELAA